MNQYFGTVFQAATIGLARQVRISRWCKNPGYLECRVKGREGESLENPPEKLRSKKKALDYLHHRKQHRYIILHGPEICQGKQASTANTSDKMHKKAILNTIKVTK